MILRKCNMSQCNQPLLQTSQLIYITHYFLETVDRLLTPELARYSFEYYVWITDFGQHTFHRIENSLSLLIVDILMSIFIEECIFDHII